MGSHDFQNDARILTENGYCQTFNTIDAKLIFRNDTIRHELFSLYQIKFLYQNQPQQWDFDEGYTPNTIENYPLRSFANGINSSYTAFLKIPKILKNFESICRKKSKNVRIILHHPAEIPDTLTNYYMVPFHKEVSIAIQPKILWCK
jgi:hypothetical protein